MALVEQRVNSWADWPVDVVDRLREWNAEFLLSFARNGDFVCGGGCGREIAGHPAGNAVLRPTPKAHGVTVCEDCLAAIARNSKTTGPYRPPDLHPHRAALAKERGRRTRLQAWCDKLEAHHAKLHRQITHDQLYIDELQTRISPEGLEAARAAMRELPR